MPTNLDTVFGPRLHGVAQSVTLTKWPRADERLRKFLDAYEDWTGFHPQGNVRTMWISGAKDWVENFGEGSLGTFKAAMDYCDRQQLRPKSPHGLIFYGLQFGIKKPEWEPCPLCSQIGSHADDCPNGG